MRLSDWLRDGLLLIHVLLVVVWLGCDFVVFSLSMSLLRRELPVEIRLDRALLAEKFDNWVLSAFMLMIPTGIALAWVNGYPLFRTPWLNVKLIFFGIIILITISIFTGAGGTTGLLKKMKAGEGSLEDLEMQLRKRVIALAPPVLVIHACIIIMIFIALSPGRWSRW